jgi:hypothetical protein
MYRDDQEALHARVDSVEREAEQLRKENEAMRRAVASQPSHAVSTLAMTPDRVYSALDPRRLPLEERARLAQHALRPFPVWVVGVLNVLTFGLFPMIHFGLMHDRLPRAASNDPSSGKAIGFQFIPYYNLYWMFFSALRLSDRLTLQFRIRGLQGAAPRGVVLAACICSVIPYVNILMLPILWTIAACMLQATVNEIAALPLDSWDASEPIGEVYQTNLAGLQLQATPAQEAALAKAMTLVLWSHILGWGGLGLLIVGGAGAAILAGGGAGAFVAAVAMVAVVVGAVIGQVGRGMQGRAI